MALSIYPESARDLAGSAKADAADMARQAVRVFRDESDSIGAMAHDPVARDGGWHHCANWQSQFRATGITAYLANGGAPKKRLGRRRRRKAGLFRRSTAVSTIAGAEPQSLVGTRGWRRSGLAYRNLFPSGRSGALTVPSVHVDKV
jgi:hypothetical protein